MKKKTWLGPKRKQKPCTRPFNTQSQTWLRLIILPRFSYQNKCLWVSHRSLLWFSQDDSTLHQFTESYRICTSNINPCFAILICEYCRITHFFIPPPPWYLQPLWLHKVTTKSQSLSHNRRIKTPPGMFLNHIEREKKFSVRVFFLVCVAWQDVPQSRSLNDKIWPPVCPFLQSLLSAPP